MHRSESDFKNNHAAPFHDGPSLSCADSSRSLELLRVGDIAEKTGKTVRAIHLYEQLGLLHPRKRTKSKYRLFGPDAVVRVRWISKLQQLGMSLADIRSFVRHCERSTAPGAMGNVRDVYSHHLAKTRKQLARLRALEQELSASLLYLEGCEGCDPRKRMRECQRCHQNSTDLYLPELVSGLCVQLSEKAPDGSHDLAVSSLSSCLEPTAPYKVRNSDGSSRSQSSAPAASKTNSRTKLQRRKLANSSTNRS